VLGVGAGGIQVEVADIGRNGMLDIVAANRLGRFVSVHVQALDGSYSLMPGPLLGDGPLNLGLGAVCVGDVDRDGDLDIVAANTGEAGLSVFHQAGDTFDHLFIANERIYGDALSLPKPTDVLITDLEGDGDADLVSVSRSVINLTVIRGVREVLFPDDRIDVKSGMPASQKPVRIAAGDLDGDGDLDLVTANVISSDLALYWNTGVRAISDMVSRIGGPGATNSPSGVALVDLDGDGLVEIIVACKGLGGATPVPGRVAIFRQAPGVVFASSPLASDVLGENGDDFNPEMTLSADFDGDGDLDIGVCVAEPETIQLYWNALGQFSGNGADPELTLVLEQDDAPSSLAATDLDGDGDLDLLATCEGSDSVAVFRQGALGFPTSPSSRFGLADQALNAPVSIATGDLNGDGVNDVVTCNLGDGVTPIGNLIIHFNEGLDGLGVLQFSAWPELDLASPTGLSPSPRQVVVEDLDDNGRADIICADRGQSQVFIYYQAGPGLFQQPLGGALGSNTLTPLVEGLCVADIDGDGRIDIVTANSRDNATTPVTLFYGDP